MKNVRIFVAKGIEKIKNSFQSVSRSRFKEGFSGKQLIERVKDYYGSHKSRCHKIFASALAAVFVAAGAWGGIHYIQSNTYEVYHVYVDGNKAGTVSSPGVVSQFIAEKSQRLAKEYPHAQMVLETDGITYQSEKAFKAKWDNESALKQLDSLLSYHAVGVELRVDGELVGIVKDEKTAEQLLEKLKDKYKPNDKYDKPVTVLSASANSAREAGGGAGQEKVELKSIEFVEQVDLKPVETDPDQIMDPDKVYEKLETGDVEPTKYIVQEGDCVSCIAAKFDISKQVIYENNPWIENDMIRVGDELDLTVLQPTLSVKTVETVQEVQDVQYQIIYKKDDSLTLGRTEVVKPGKVGKKRVTFQLTKINGKLMAEELIDEQILVKPVAAIIKKGTKVVLGQGTGIFAWPISKARLTSSFGMRWGSKHKGIDLVSSNKTIYAADNGTVTYSGWKSGYGNCIVIDHGNGYETLYAHMSKLYVTKGKKVAKGDKIGYMGNTGNSTGEHLHFEVHKGGKAVNPLQFLNK